MIEAMLKPISVPIISPARRSETSTVCSVKARNRPTRISRSTRQAYSTGSGEWPSGEPLAE